MKKILALLTILLLIVIVVLTAQNYLKTLSRSKTPTATINNHVFKLEIAKTPKEKEVGLSAKKTLEKDFGMLFIQKE